MTSKPDPQRKQKRALWDESNLKENEDYFKEHPVTMKITEGKTPFERSREWEQEFHEGDVDNDTWRTDANHVARDTKIVIAHGLSHHHTQEIPTPQEAPTTTTTPSTDTIATKKKGPPPVIETTHSLPEVPEHLTQEEQDIMFEKMRKAVLKDEAAKFKELMRRAKEEEEEEDDG
eukprot:PhF_6_TR38029/c0_g1_i1/m.56759